VQAGTVVMGMQFPSTYENLIEKAKGLSTRTFVLANAVVGAATV
jgi:translation initiation factor 3 subunit E